MFGKCLPKSYQVRISLNEYNYNNIYRIIYTKLIYQSYVGQWWGVKWASISIFVTYNERTKRATMPFMTILNEVCWRFSWVLFIWLIKRWLQQMKTKSSNGVEVTWINPQYVYKYCTIIHVQSYFWVFQLSGAGIGWEK